MTSALPIVFSEAVRLNGTHRDGRPIIGCHGDFLAHYVRPPGTGAAFLLGLTAIDDIRSRGGPSAAAQPTSSGSKR